MPCTAESNDDMESGRSDPGSPPRSPETERDAKVTSRRVSIIDTANDAATTARLASSPRKTSLAGGAYNVVAIDETIQPGEPCVLVRKSVLLTDVIAELLSQQGRRYRGTSAVIGIDEALLVRPLTRADGLPSLHCQLGPSLTSRS